MVEIELDKKRYIKFNSFAISRAEKELKRPIQKILNEDSLGITELAVLLWVGLTEKVTLEESYDLMDTKPWGDIAQKIAEALQLAFQKGSEAGENLEN